MTNNNKGNWESNEELSYFREYLRIPSVHPNPDYGECLAFLHRQAKQLKLPISVYYPVNDKNPVVVMSWSGSKPKLPSVLLNSHMDVVPVFQDQWTHPPFAAEMDEEGRIFGRGAQDMKCVGTQYLGAIRALKASGYKPKRTINLSFVADEEMGGRRGMREFVHSKEFRALNIGFGLDEGLASPTNQIPVFYAERSVWRVYFKINGTTGHGSLLLPQTAGEKLEYILDRMMELRRSQVKRLEEDPSLTIGDVTTVNLTQIGGGVQSNVLPPQLMACFDVRLSLDIDHGEFEAQLHKWAEEAGGDIQLEYEQKQPPVPPTATDESNPFWVAFKRATDEMNLVTRLEIFAGGTDSRYLRGVGIPALGFSPMNNTPILLHDHDEFLQADVYLRGIEIFKRIIANVANV